MTPVEKHCNPKNREREEAAPSRVALKRCGSYSTEKVYSAVKGAIRELGGIKEYVKKGDKVLIKPNLLAARAPEKAVTTHPEVVRAVIRIVRESGAVPTVGDSHGGARCRMEEVYRATGIRRICQEEKTETVIFDRFKTIKGIPVALAAIESDVLISVPKFKTHSLTLITCGIKNIFGVVPGLYKTRLHMEAPNPEAFAETLTALFASITPVLNVVDAITAMEGEGPGSAGTPRNMNLTAASSDAVALDALLCKITGIEPFSVPAIRLAHEKNLGQGIPRNIKVSGETWESFRLKDFKLPGTTLYHRIPNTILKPLASLLKISPEISGQNCVLCRACVRSCPAGAIRLKQGRMVVDKRRCILCLCCLEFCPENAVEAKPNLFYRLIRG